MRMRPVYLVAIAALVLAGGILVVRGSGAQDLPEITVYKSPTCGCCAKWVTHLEENGFDVKSIDTPNVNTMKKRYGVPGDLTSCHTAVIDGYVVEGHVPADVIKQMIEEHPEAAGIAVPGMPVGSPGMEGPNPEEYDIMAFQKDGGRSVYATR